MIVGLNWPSLFFVMYLKSSVNLLDQYLYTFRDDLCSGLVLLNHDCKYPEPLLHLGHYAAIEDHLRHYPCLQRWWKAVPEDHREIVKVIFQEFNI